MSLWPGQTPQRATDFLAGTAFAAPNRGTGGLSAVWVMRGRAIFVQTAPEPASYPT